VELTTVRIYHFNRSETERIVIITVFFHSNTVAVGDKNHNSKVGRNLPLFEKLKVMKSNLLAIFITLLITTSGMTQDPFSVHLEPFEIQGLGGLQSFTSAQHGGMWLLVGGRLDGLHRRQPWASFDQAGHNTQLTVVDPESEQVWTAPLSALPTAIAEQLSSTNMQFTQNGDFLYIIGGYGYSATAGDHITHSQLCAINVPGAIDAIVTGGDIAPHFRAINDETLAVTGGYLHQLDGKYYLVGGHRFDGRYNPMDGPSFTQEYTNAVRVFEITDDESDLSIAMTDTWLDEAACHRRDYNVGVQIMPDGSEGLTAFSGVFQTNADLPYLNAVNIGAEDYTIQDDFSQYFNHYHCAHVALHSGITNEMHTVFFGGIAQYYMDGETLMQDDDVPFVNTIARVTRNSNGNMAEYKLPVEMPGLLGAGSEFIEVPNLPTHPNGVIKLDELGTDSLLIGYIVGGISSSAPNIFWVNDGTQSEAYSTLFKVYLTLDETLSADQLNPMSTASLAMQVYPNPGDGNLTVSFGLKTPEPVELQLMDLNGKLILKENHGPEGLITGSNKLSLNLGNIPSASYLLQIKTKSGLVAVQRIVIR